MIPDRHWRSTPAPRCDMTPELWILPAKTRKAMNMIAVEPTISRDHLLQALRDEKYGAPEGAHLTADELLLCYIGDPEIREAFEAVPKWYS